MRALPFRRTHTRFMIVVLTGLLVGHTALADDHGEGEGEHGWRQWLGLSHHSDRTAALRAAPPAYAAECGACHLAYPPGLLPAGSWQRLMGHLDQHFGTDASLDAAQVQAISSYLQDNAGTYKRVSEMPPEDRITRSYWFLRKHNKHVSPSTWQRPAIGSPSNCAACHPDAATGSFDEHTVRIP